MLQELELAEDLVNTFAVRAKRYWKEWGQLGEPAIVAIDVWAEAQLLYLRGLGAAVKTIYTAVCVSVEPLIFLLCGAIFKTR